MAWCRIHLTEDERRIVNEERASHPNLLVRNKMPTIWLLHCGMSIARRLRHCCGSRATVSDTWTRTAKAIKGLRIRASEAVASWPSADDAHPGVVRGHLCVRLPRHATVEKLSTHPSTVPPTVREIPQRPGIEVVAPPIPWCSILARHVHDQMPSLSTRKAETETAPPLKPVRVTCFHCGRLSRLFGTISHCQWSFTRISVVHERRGVNGFNVLGAWNAVTRELNAVTNTTVCQHRDRCAQGSSKITVTGLGLD